MSTPISFGGDLSQFQGALSIGALVKQGFSFFAAKCTEGQHGWDQTYARHLQEAKDNHALFLAYHFLHSDSSPVAQADNLAAHIIDKNVRVMIDEEVEGSSRPTLQTANAFRDALWARHGIKATILYDPHFWWQQTGSPSLAGWHLWQAEYPWNNHEFASVIYTHAGSGGWAAEGGVVPTIWQFASSAKVSGYSGNVDVDAFRGTRDDLAALGIFTDFAPKKPVAPSKPAGPTRIQRVHQEYAAQNVVDLNLLDAAVQAGRHGIVGQVTLDIVAQVHRVPNDSALTALFHHKVDKQGLVDLNLLATAISRGRTGAIHSAFHNIQADMAKLPMT